MTALIDCHSHSSLSGHGEGSIQDAVSRAMELGLHTYVQTEHLILPSHIDPHYEVSMASHVMQDYYNELSCIRDDLYKQGRNINLVIGIEADWLDNRGPELTKLCKGFEYVLGSIHYINEFPFDSPFEIDAWDNYGKDNIWNLYLEKFIDLAESEAPIDCFSHPDLPKVHGIYPDFDLIPYYEKMASAVAKNGAMVEVNTAGLRKKVGELYPAPELLKMFREYNIDCTVGADAHRPQDIGANVLEAYELMKSVGYDKVAVPQRGHDRDYFYLD